MPMSDLITDHLNHNPKDLRHMARAAKRLGGRLVHAQKASFAYANDQVVVAFPNGYAASVITGRTAYNGPDRYELAVMEPSLKIDSGFDITYDTPVTNDVIGHLVAKEVAEFFDEIAALPAHYERRVVHDRYFPHLLNA